MEENQIRVTVTGTEAIPTATVRESSQGLVLSISISAAEMGEIGEEIELVVTAEQADDYYVPNTTTGTRIEVPLRELPLSIQSVSSGIILRSREDPQPKERWRRDESRPKNNPF